MVQSRPRVVIIGAGFAGLEAAKHLGGHGLDVVVIDRRNHHLFQPLLYQVATAGLSPGEIAMPVRAILRDRPDTTVLMADIKGIDTAKRLVLLDHEETVSYDYLILATGATHSYFDHPEWEPLAPGLKSLDDATEIRRRILLAFERAERSKDEAERQALLTFVLIGGGPTGIELAGAIAELARYSLVRDFNHINPRLAKIRLIEAGPRLLGSFAPSAANMAMKSLTRLGVQVTLNKRVTDITAFGVTMSDGEFLAAHTVIWAAGVKPSPLAKDLSAAMDRSGRVIVAPDLSVPGHPEIFVCGDLAAVVWRGEQMVPGMAPGAIQEGRGAARNLLRRIKGKPTVPFRYQHKGSMATIGRASAVVELGRLSFDGFSAWTVWLVVHIFYLIGFQNRLLVITQWAWSYFTFQRGARLITGRSDHPEAK